MKIKKITPDVTGSVMRLNSGTKLLPVTLTFKRFWSGKEVVKKAFPTNHGPTYGSGKIQYFMYVNEVGEEYDDEICKQINNFMINFFLQNKAE